jgi:hypothetical protein
LEGSYANQVFPTNLIGNVLVVSECSTIVVSIPLKKKISFNLEPMKLTGNSFLCVLSKTYFISNFYQLILFCLLNSDMLCKASVNPPYFGFITVLINCDKFFLKSTEISKMKIFFFQILPRKELKTKKFNS